MAMINKTCAACSGNLYFYSDIDGFNSLKCMQCSREYTESNINKGKINAA
jgi:hypothetical protein